MAGIDSISESAPIDIEVSGAQGPRGLAGPNSVTSATTSDGSANLSLAAATVSGLLTAGHIHGNLAGTIYTHVRTGEAMSKGDPFYISGYHVGSSQPIAMRADANDSAKMPAIGVMDADYAAHTSGANGIISGTLSNINTAGFMVNSAIYVADGGGYSDASGTIPQQIGITERANASTGAFIVSNVTTHPYFSDVTIAGALIVGGLDIAEEIQDINDYLTSQPWAPRLVTGVGPHQAVNGEELVLYNLSTAARINDPAGLPAGHQYKVTVVAGSFQFNGAGTIFYATRLSVIRACNGSAWITLPVTFTDSVTFDTTSYAYVGGAAAAHRTALGVSAAPVGPYANDAAAASGGVAIGSLYYTADGSVKRRMA